MTLVRSGPVADLFRAVQQPLGRQVLIKALSRSILPSSPFAATLEREARLLAELDHPNVPHLYDFSRTGERMWLVLEWVEGWTLEELLERMGRLEPAVATAITLEVARALDHAHRRGIIHRDVQPRNVLIDQKGTVKLTGFAVAMDQRTPASPELLDGSTSFSGPAYLSPEQILGEPADQRSDLFSLGVVLYEVLSGQRPFDAPDERTTTQRIRHHVPLPLTRRAPGIPAALERIAQHCLEKMPSDRFHSADELMQALKEVQRELGGGSARTVIREYLLRAGLSQQAERLLEEPALSIPAPSRRGWSLPLAVGGLLACSSLAVLGGGAIQYLYRGGEAAGERARSVRLELVPAASGHLRVVADPWAHVVVDGQRVETTPFARGIPLAAGTHYVRLEHPNAPVERRTVRLVPGETVLLDVKMAVERPQDAGADSAASPLVDAGADALPSP